MTRIGDRITVSWTNEATVAVGHHSCEWCGTETPIPTSDVIVEYAQTEGSRTLWPFDGSFDWCPPGWTRDEDGRSFCSSCAKERARVLAVAERRCKARRNTGDPNSASANSEGRLAVNEQVGSHPAATLEIVPEPQLGCVRIRVREPSGKASIFVDDEQIATIVRHLADLCDR